MQKEEEADSPSQWHKLYPIAQGNRQSPINIVSSQAVYSPSLQPLELSYEACTSLSIANNGHSVQVDFNDSDDRTVVTGGPLDGPYRLKQFHFHWGKKHGVGSEHTVDGKSFPSELHLVHWNAKKYSTFGEAALAPDGLAVVGVFLETGDEHPSMNRLTDALYMVRFKGTKAQFSCFNPKCLLPTSQHYWTYPGSLTTPPLSESVTWIVLQEPISVSERQALQGTESRTLLLLLRVRRHSLGVQPFQPEEDVAGVTKLLRDTWGIRVERTSGLTPLQPRPEKGTGSGQVPRITVSVHRHAQTSKETLLGFFKRAGE
ncbi:carbonic anhydrase 7 isoform X2 [Choloepus didactylus]|uniref:carbonic anhydrase 7 isoform X2 n=1 Tax=Choloepus didactylus TaxID=27675 RepID=UPI0018A08F5C|nr:carbonic anhydrase 7 isoform X2 [Choloepus didactylus]